ncbi:MAG: glucosaminidase domain-containing protein [Bacilli bacterium]|nr:glucosaminidase domain-containing protein [Bacilli bacterium]
MKKGKIISSVLAVVGVGMISIALTLQSNSYMINDNNLVTNYSEINIKNMAASTNGALKKTDAKKVDSDSLKEANMEVAPASVTVPPRVEVYENMTMDELANKLNRSLSNEMSGKGLLIANKCIELGVDPFIATAIMLHETGCSQGSCSHIARTCHNFGGQKGSGCGAYQAYPSVDEGIVGMITNLYNNFYSRGLNTVETIGPRYAESPVWSMRINSYVGKLKAA